MRADIHDGPEHTLQSEAGYIDARPLSAGSMKPLATRGRTIHWGQTRLVPQVQLTPRLPLCTVSGRGSAALHSRRVMSRPFDKAAHNLCVSLFTRGQSS